jgi:hypothetical protein
MCCFTQSIHSLRLSVGGRTDARTHRRKIFTQYSGISSCSLGSTDCSLHPGAYSTHTTHPQPYNFHLSWHSLLLEGAVRPNQEHLLHGVLVFHASLPQWVLILSVCSRCSHRCWMKVRMLLALTLYLCVLVRTM